MQIEVDEMDKGMKRLNYSMKCQSCGLIRFGNLWIAERREKAPSYTYGYCPGCLRRNPLTGTRTPDPASRGASRFPHT